jgi:hypothetical protein
MMDSKGARWCTHRVGGQSDVDAPHGAALAQVEALQAAVLAGGPE